MTANQNQTDFKATDDTCVLKIHRTLSHVGVDAKIVTVIATLHFSCVG